MKSFIIPAVSALALSAGLAQAQDTAPEPTWTFGWSVTATSDYLFRGQTQTGHDFAVQGGLTLNHASGFYAGVWASNVDFGNGTDAELDFSAGYAFDLSDNLTLDLNVTYYTYINAPANSKYNYAEFASTLTYSLDAFSIYGKVAYANDFFGGAGPATWIGAGTGYEFTDWLKASGNIGYQWYDNNLLVGADDYFHYDIGLTLSQEPFALDLRYYDTSLSKAQCFGGTNACSPRFVVALSLSF